MHTCQKSNVVVLHRLQLRLSFVIQFQMSKKISQMLTSNFGPSPTSATWLKMCCSSSRLKSASLVPKILASTYCKAERTVLRQHGPMAQDGGIALSVATPEAEKRWMVVTDVKLPYRIPK